jgi:hypothetical protein
MLYKMSLDSIMLYKLDKPSLNASLLQLSPTTNLLVTSPRQESGTITMLTMF